MLSFVNILQIVHNIIQIFLLVRILVMLYRTQKMGINLWRVGEEVKIYCQNFLIVFYIFIERYYGYWQEFQDLNIVLIFLSILSYAEHFQIFY